METVFEVNTLETFSEIASAKRHNPFGEADDENPLQKKRGPPPRRSRKPRVTRKAPTRLRKDRPVQTGLPMDIWGAILSFCSLDKLLKLRHICVTFHSALNSDTTWKQARINQFGSDQPGPPTGITEMQYADLLVGVGCQDAKCTEKSTRRTYWAFQRRWCEKCCASKLIKGRRARDIYAMYDRIAKCLPYGMYDSWSHYQWAGHRDNPPNWAGSYGASTQTFSKADFEKFEEQRLKFLEIARSQEETDGWFAKQEAINAAHMDHIQKIEAWIEADKKSRELERSKVREHREIFFLAKSLEMKPPLEKDALMLCPAYERAILISKPPTLKSWQQLRDKLLEERSMAEVRAAKVQRAQSHKDYRTFLATNHDETLERRKDRTTPEMLIVSDLADKVIRESGVDSGRIHDADIVNVVLRGVYDEYQRLEDSGKPDYGFKNGPYRLVLDDARHVYNEKILPILRGYGISRMAIAERLKCPAPACRDHCRYYSFEKLMEHLQTPWNHIEGYDYCLPRSYPPNRDSLWYCLEWPRNLPALSSHQSSTNNWDVDAETPYIQVPEDTKPPGEDPGEMRRVVEIEVLRGIVFTGSIILALETLHTRSFDGRLKTIIALEFAHKQHHACHGEMPTGGQVDEMIQWIDGQGLFDQIEEYGCVRCHNPVKIYGPARKARSLFSLVCHYLDEHCNGAASTHTALGLPENANINTPRLLEGTKIVEHGYLRTVSGNGDDGSSVISDDGFW